MQQLVPASSHVSSPLVRCFFHKGTNTCSYIVQCPTTKKAAVIDSVLDYSLHSGKLGTEYADSMVSEVEKEGLRVEWIVDTHVHADHITASAYMKNKWPWAKTAISNRITEVQKEWTKRLEWKDFACDGRQWDMLVDADTFKVEIGTLTMTAMKTPGHTPACTTYVVGDTCFVGDALFQPDFGTARVRAPIDVTTVTRYFALQLTFLVMCYGQRQQCDFPGGSPRDLFHSVSSIIYALPDHFRLFVGHDYPPATRSVLFFSDILSEKAQNKFLSASTSLDDFVSARTSRDNALDTPSLLYPSIQFNINAGRIPSQNSEINHLAPSAHPTAFFVKTPLTIPSSLQNIM